jgi:hypothetical protein
MICFKCKHFELQGTNIVCWKYDPVSIRDERTSCTDFEDKNDQEVREHIDSILPDEECSWNFNVHYNSYDTECGEVFMISEEPEILNYNFKFCPFCGKKMSKKV